MVEFDGHIFLKTFSSDLILKIFGYVPKQLLMKINDVSSISKYILKVVYNTCVIVNGVDILHPGEYFRKVKLIEESEKIPLVDDDFLFVPTFINIDKFIDFRKEYPDFNPNKLIFENVEDFIRLHNLIPETLQGIQSFEILIPSFFSNNLNLMLGGESVSEDERFHALNALIASMPYNIESLKEYPISLQGLLVPDSVKELEVVAEKDATVDFSLLKDLPNLTRLKITGAKLEMNDLENLPSNIESLQLIKSLVIEDCSDPQFPTNLKHLEINPFKMVSDEADDDDDEADDISFDLSSLENLKTLKLSNVRSSSLDSLELPKNLKSLIINESKSLTSLGSLKKYHLENLEVFETDKLPPNAILSEDVLPVGLKSLRITRRKPRDIDEDAGVIQENIYLPPNLKKFNLQDGSFDMGDDFKLPESITSLTIIGCRAPGLKSLVLNLKELNDLTLIRIEKLQGIENTIFPRHLRNLVIRNCGVLVFADTNINELTYLKILELDAYTFDFGKFPKNLESIKLRSSRFLRRNEDIVDVTCTSGEFVHLKELVTSSKQEISGVSFPNLRKLTFVKWVFKGLLDKICPNVTEIIDEDCDHSLEDFENLDKLKYLRINSSFSVDNIKDNFCFPKSLEELDLNGCRCGDGKIAKLNLHNLSNLKILNLTYNRLTEIKSSWLPKSLVHLSLGQNKFKVLDLKDLESLEVLRLNRNEFEEFQEGDVQFPKSLVILDANSIGKHRYGMDLNDHFPIGHCKRLKTMYGREEFKEEVLKIAAEV